MQKLLDAFASVVTSDPQSAINILGLVVAILSLLIVLKVAK
jgi:hypothetical protein